MARWENTLRTNDEINRLKREAVIRESARIFSRRGYHNASLDDVAKSLNVSKGTLYNYVTDKEEILFESLKLALDLGEKAFEIAEQEAGTGADKLRSTLRNYISMLHDELGACGMLHEVDALKPRRTGALVRRVDRTGNGRRQSAADGQEACGLHLHGCGQRDLTLVFAQRPPDPCSDRRGRYGSVARRHDRAARR